MDEMNQQTQVPQPQAQQPQMQAAPQPVPQAQAALNANTPVQQQTAAPLPVPFKIDRLGKNKDYTYTDKNGYEWHYQFQFPGIRKMMAILDDCTLANGTTSNALLWEAYCENVIVQPHGLKLDDFDTRPGLNEVMAAADEFCGSRLSL